MITKTEFVNQKIPELLDDGFSVFLHNKVDLEGYGGWLSTDDKCQEFVVAMKHPLAFEIFIHEYCHYQQWKFNRDFWDKSTETYDLLFDWISNKDLVCSEEQIDESLKTIITIEHDCESRVLNMVAKNPIRDFDTERYIRAVNAYLWSYHINRELRKKPKTTIYNERVMPNMPTVFGDLNYYLHKENMTDKMRQVFLQEYEKCN